MSVNVVLNGTTYTIPDPGDNTWGQNLTDYFVALGSGVLQKSGGAFTLTAEVNFGATYGLKSVYYKSRATNPSSTGQIRLGNAEFIGWRNAANNDDMELAVDASDRLTYNGNPIVPSTPLTASRAVVTDISGALTVAATTAIEIGYSAGVTSAIQTQLNNKQATGNYITALTGDVTAAGPGSVAATIGANKVTLGMMAQISTARFLGRTTAATGDVESLTVTQATALLNAFVGDSGSGGTKGLVPAPAAGDAAAGKVLGAGGSWVTSGAGDVVGPAASVDSELVLFSGTTGKLLKRASGNGAVSVVSGVVTQGTLGATVGGTAQSTWTQGDMLYASASNTLAKLAKGTTGQYLSQTSTIPAWASFTAPTVQTFTSTGTQTGWLFTISSGSATVGATYTNNSNTYTVLNTVASGTLIAMSGTGATSGGTLTKSAGTGDATLTFSAKVALATYTKPANVLYLKYRAVGAGSGGSCSGTAGGGAVSAAGASFFGGSIAGGGGSLSALDTVGGTGGVATLVLGSRLQSLNGASGCGAGAQAVVNVFLAGGMGGVSPFGGAGAGGGGSGSPVAGKNAVANSGSGGGGAGIDETVNANAGAGGSAGAYIEAIVTSPASTYAYVIGAGSAGGTLGTNGAAGGNGADGYLVVEEYYQ